ncbi:MAG: hypothetical protein Q4G68_11015 [Planctomycetia bacterium]|nr:hypothetical protein [Planctomycetia bacterium]
MRLTYLIIFGSLLLSRIDSLAISSESQGIALLQGIANERLKYDCLEIRYDELRREEGTSVAQVIKFDHGNIRKEHLPNGTFQGTLSLYASDTVYMKTTHDSTSVELVPFDSSLASGVDIYDPRLLGLTDTPSLQMSMDTCLGLSSGRNISVKQTVLDGKNVFLVTEKLNEATWEYYVEEPSFRLLKKIVRDGIICIQIDNEYSNPDLVPFPTRVNILRKERDKIRLDRTITVTNLEKRKSFPANTFTLGSFGLPLNAVITDYHIDRVAGYWDGEKLVGNPVRMSIQEQRKLEKKLNAHPFSDVLRWCMMILGACCVFFAITVKIRRQLHNRESIYK